MLIVLPESVTGDDHAAVVESLTADLDAQVIARRGETATEYVSELGPTIDCAVSLSDDDDLVGALVDASDGVPVVVYGETRVDGVDEVLGPEVGVDDLVASLSGIVAADREQSELAEMNAKLTALSRHASAITGCESVDEVCDRTLTAAVDALAFTFCTVALAEGDRIVPRASTLPPESQLSCRIGEGVAGRTYRTGETQIVGELDTDEDALFTETRRSAVSVPLGPYGVIQVVSDAPGAFTDRDAEFLEILADYTTEALARVDRETALRRERDRFHAFFENVPVPVVYVEEVDHPGGRLRCETNHAYQRTFPERPDCASADVESVFPTEAEREAFAEHLRGDGPTAATVDRETTDGDVETLSLTVVPVPAAGPLGAAYGVYVRDDPPWSSRS